MIAPTVKCPDGKAAHIMNMYVAPGYRKQGIGTELFKLTVEEADIRNAKKLTLNATDMGRPLYEKYGFESVGGSMVFYVE